MSTRHAVISVRPERCDRCGACVAACSKRLIRVGAGYLYVDPSGCDGCLACARVCTRNAIEGGTAKGALGTPVVGSRAEAKALRRAAAQAEKGSVKRVNVPATPAAQPSASTKAAAPATKAASTSKAAPAAKTAGASRAAAPGGTPWSLLDAMAILSVLLVAFLLKEAALASTLFEAMPAQGQMTARGVVLAVFYVVQLGALAFVVSRHGRSFSEAFRAQDQDRSANRIAANVVLVAGLFVGTRAISLAWGVLARAMGFAVPAGERIVDLFGSGPGGLVVSALVVAIVAPMTEELVFRGIVLGGLENRFGRWPAILGSAVAFAALHMTPWLLLSTFTLGVACGWLASARRSLASAIALHALYNGAVVAAAILLAT